MTHTRYSNIASTSRGSSNRTALNKRCFLAHDAPKSGVKVGRHAKTVADLPPGRVSATVHKLRIVDLSMTFESMRLVIHRSRTPASYETLQSFLPTFHNPSPAHRISVKGAVPSRSNSCSQTGQPCTPDAKEYVPGRNTCPDRPLKICLTTASATC